MSRASINAGIRQGGEKILNRSGQGDGGRDEQIFLRLGVEEEILREGE